jgi:uncharacterized protein (TIGR02145 family)
MTVYLFNYLLLACILAAPTWAQEKGTFTDDRDGSVYLWITIGNQTWMAGNLAWLPRVNRVDDALFDGKCHYVYGYDGNDLAEAKAKSSYRRYGALYNWEAALESCPAGWHLPTDQEWKELERYLGMEDADRRGWREAGETGKKLKSTTGWMSNNGSDETGFHALPGGCRGYQGFESLGYCGYFWTASPAGGDNGWRRGFCGDDNGSCREEERRYFGASVRCVKN